MTQLIFGIILAAWLYASSLGMPHPYDKIMLVAGGLGLLAIVLGAIHAAWKKSRGQLKPAPASGHIWRDWWQNPKPVPLSARLGFLLFALLSVWLTRKVAWPEIRLGINHQMATARIDRKYGCSGEEWVGFCVDYSFTPTGSQSRFTATREQVSRAFFETNATGAPIVVRYFPDNPNVSQIGSGSIGEWGEIIFLLLFLAIVPAFWAVIELRHRRAIQKTNANPTSIIH